jgi:hypothetical protein
VLEHAHQDVAAVELDAAREDEAVVLFEDLGDPEAALENRSA